MVIIFLVVSLFLILVIFLVVIFSNLSINLYVLCNVQLSKPRVFVLLLEFWSLFGYIVVYNSCGAVLLNQSSQIISFV